MQAFVDLFVNELRNERYNESFTCAMTWAFQPACNLHKNHFQLSDEDIKRLATSRQAWRGALKQGDRVDFKIVADEKKKTKGWVQAVIASV